MSVLRRKWNFKCGMLAVACLGFFYQSCSSQYKREKEFQDELFYTSNPYKSAVYRNQEFKALLTFKTTDELEKFVKNLSVRLPKWEKSDHYKALFRHTGRCQPIDIWKQYRRDYLGKLEDDLDDVGNSNKELVASYHNAMGKIFESPHDHQRQQALIACYKSLGSKIRKKISAFYLENYSGEKIGNERLQRSLLNFYLLMDFVYGGDRSLEWCGAIKQVGESLKERSFGNEQSWDNFYKNHKDGLEHDPVWRYEENIRTVGKFIELTDRLINGTANEGVFDLTFEEVQSVIPYGVLLLSGHLDYLDQDDSDVKRLRELCDLFRPIAMV